MKKSANLDLQGLLPIFVLLIVLGFVVFLGLTNRTFLWVRSEISALITIGVIGMALCTRGIGRVAETGAWAHPLSILAYLVGLAIIVITVLAALGQPIPLIPSTRSAIMVIVVMIAVKFLISFLHGAVFMAQR
jgi:hypothetical protein